jgi:hypothetical protein
LYKKKIIIYVGTTLFQNTCTFEFEKWQGKIEDEREEIKIELERMKNERERERKRKREREREREHSVLVVGGEKI